MQNDKWPELCEQIIAVISQALQGNKSAEEIMLLLIEQFGGQILYLPKAVSFKAFIQAQQIYKDFNGRNHKQLCKKYDLTEPRIYQIIQEQRELRRTKDQTVIDFMNYK